MPVNGEYSPARSPENLAKAPFMSFSTPTRWSLVIPGESPNPWMDRPTRILTECTGTSDPTFPLILSTLMSETCLKPAGRPWYSQMSGSKISAKSMYESSSPAYIPQCWLSNSTAQAMALANVNWEVLETMPASLSHFSLVTCLATKECLDLISGKGPPAAIVSAE